MSSLTELFNQNASNATNDSCIGIQEEDVAGVGTWSALTHSTAYMISRKISHFSIHLFNCLPTQQREIYWRHLACIFWFDPRISRGNNAKICCGYGEQVCKGKFLWLVFGMKREGKKCCKRYSQTVHRNGVELTRADYRVATLAAMFVTVAGGRAGTDKLY